MTDKKITENKPDVPYIVYEGDMARSERHIKRLWIALIVVTVSFLISNLAWIWWINQYVFESYEVTAEGDGHANYIGQDGDIYNGSESISAATQKEKSSNSKRNSDSKAP